MKWKVFVLIVIILLLAISLIFIQKYKNPQKSPIAPTLQPSPTATNQNPGWQTFKDDMQHVTFEYPQDLATKYIHSQEWPPKIVVSPDRFSCKEGNGASGTTISKTIGKTTYCITSMSEGAAGTIYTAYAYSFTNNNKLITLTFTLGYPQCANYEDPQKIECQRERQTFDLDTLIHRIAQSVRLYN